MFKEQRERGSEGFAMWNNHAAIIRTGKREYLQIRRNIIEQKEKSRPLSRIQNENEKKTSKGRRRRIAGIYQQQRGRYVWMCAGAAQL